VQQDQVVVKECIKGHFETNDKSIRFCPKCGKKLRQKKPKSNRQGRNRPKPVFVHR